MKDANVRTPGDSFDPQCGSTAYTFAPRARAPWASQVVDRPFHDPISTMAPRPVHARAAENSALP